MTEKKQLTLSQLNFVLKLSYSQDDLDVWSLRLILKQLELENYAIPKCCEELI